MKSVLENIFRFILNWVSVSVSMWGHTCDSGYLKRSEEGISSLGAGADRSSCEPPIVDAGN